MLDPVLKIFGIFLTQTFLIHFWQSFKSIQFSHTKIGLKKKYIDKPDSHTEFISSNTYFCFKCFFFFAKLDKSELKFV